MQKRRRDEDRGAQEGKGVNVLSSIVKRQRYFKDKNLCGHGASLESIDHGGLEFDVIDRQEIEQFNTVFLGCKSS